MASSRPAGVIAPAYSNCGSLQKNHPVSGARTTPRSSLQDNLSTLTFSSFRIDNDCRLGLNCQGIDLNPAEMLFSPGEHLTFSDLEPATQSTRAGGLLQ